MSHNSIKINNKTPNADGSLSLAIDELSDVTGPFSDGSLLTYNASAQEWQSGSAGGAPFAIFGRGESDVYTNCGFPTTGTNKWGFYDTAPTTCSGVTFNYVSGTSWLTSITLGVGKWIFQVQAAAAFSATGYLGINVLDGSGTIISTTGAIGDNLTFYGGGGSLAQGAIDITSGTQTLTIRISQSSNVASAATQGNTPAEGGWILIQKAL